MNDDFLSEEEYLTEMAELAPMGSNNYGILIGVSNETARKGNPYFKVYNATKYRSATKVARISFFNNKLITGHSTMFGKTEWKIYGISSKTRKLLVEYLNSPSSYPGITIWTELKYVWNYTNEFNMLPMDKYISGDIDKLYSDNPDYVPYSLEMPDYTQLRT